MNKQTLTLLVACLLSAINVFPATKIAINASPHNTENAPGIKALLEGEGYSVDIVTASEIDTKEEIDAYAAVIIGDSGIADNDWALCASSINDYVQRGGGLLASGWVAHLLEAKESVPALEELLPVGAGGVYAEQTTITSGAPHPINEGVDSWTTASFDAAGGPVKTGVIVISRNSSGHASVVAWHFGNGRVIHLGPNYLSNNEYYNNVSQYDGTIPSARKLLLNSVAWVARVRDCASVQAELAATVQTLENVSAQNTLLEAERNAALTANQILSEQVTALQASLNSANVQVQQLGSANAELQLQLASSQSVVATLGAEKHALQVVNTGLTAELAASELQVQQLGAANAELQLQLTSSQTAVATLIAEKLALQVENTGLTADLALVGISIESLSVNLAANASDAEFTIPGSSYAEQLNALVQSLIELNSGQKQAIYVNLGGSPSRKE